MPALLLFAALAAGCVNTDVSPSFPIVAERASATHSPPTNTHAEVHSAAVSPVALLPQRLNPPGSCLTETQKIGQLLAVLLTPAQLSSVQDEVNRGELGFIGLLGKPDKGISTSLRILQRDAPFPVLIASDEESRTVQRLARAIAPLPSVKQLLKMPSAKVQKLFKDYGSHMIELGVSVNFAPVLDVGFGPGIGNRAFGSDPDKVVEYAGAVARGLQEAGVMPVLKHFPGHGRASADSHKSLPVTPYYSDLQPDLQPYRELLGDLSDNPSSAGSSQRSFSVQSPPLGVMIAHLRVPGLTAQHPSSLSTETINGLLRTEMGFEGLVFTDALNMGAITSKYSAPEAAVLALQAGADVVILSGTANLQAASTAIRSALATGKLNRDSVDRSVAKVFQLKTSNRTHCSS